jgi:hypothetical protein
MAASIALLAALPAAAERPRARAMDLLLLWDASLAASEQDPLDLGAFLGTVRDGDRVGVLGFGQSVATALPLRRVSAAESRSLAYEVLDALPDGGDRAEPTPGLRAALDLLKAKGDATALRAVVLVTAAGAEIPRPDGEAADAGSSGAAEQLLAEYLLEEVILHAVIRGQGGAPTVEAAVATAGGRSLAVPPGSSLAHALSFAYESLQLTAIETAREQGEDRGATEDDYSFLDETKSMEEIEQSLKDEAAARDRQRLGEPTSPMSTALLIVLVALAALTLVLLVFLAFRLVPATGSRDRPRAVDEERMSPAFSKLTLGLNQFTRIFDEAGEKLRALSLDLEDFGAASWEIEQRMLDNYASVTDSLFLLIDHLEVQTRGERSSAESDWFLMRLRQLLEDENIAEIAVGPGDELDPELCSRAGDREDPAPPGTVLEVVRKGYLRRRGPTGDDLVLRQAEVIVSRGIAGGGGGAKEE